MTTIDVQPSALGQLAYHVACAAHLAAGERSEDCVPHAVLSWALLEAIGGEHLEAAINGFDLPDDVGDIRSRAAQPVRDRAGELALQLCAHFTSEGRHDVGGLYQAAYERLTERV
jgi:hypothetical protein